MWGLQFESKGLLRFVFTVWQMDPRQYSRSENGGSIVFKKFNMLKM